MAEQHDEFQARSAAEPASHEPGEGAGPAAGSHPPAGEAGARPAESPPPAAHAAGGNVPPSPGAAPPGRFRRWSASRPLQFVAAGLLAGLVGGLVGGGVVAAFSDDGHGHGRYVRIERGGPWGGNQFRPRYWGPPPGGQWAPPVQPGMPAQPNPAPSPKTSG
jgi:hypothetical protein